MSQPARFSRDPILRRLRGVKSTSATANVLAPKIRISVSLRALFVIALLTFGTTISFAVPSRWPKGLTINQPAKVNPGYVIMTPPDGRTYAIDVNGQVAKSWDSPIANSTIGYAKPLDNHNLLMKIKPNTGTVQQMVEMDQSGNIVWQWTDTAGRTLHHDQTRLKNGNTLMACSFVLNYPLISDKPLTDDCLVVVDPNGQIVFTWQTADHFDEFGFSDADKASIYANAGDWAHMNSAQEIPPNPNSSDPRFKPGNYMVSYRHINMIIIVDPATGKIVWKADNVTIGQHDPNIIPTGLAGAGNVLVLDNGYADTNNNLGTVLARDFSRVLEINPFNFSLAYDYDATTSGLPFWWFYTPFIGSVQRLPNGNTIVCEGDFGRTFEITPNGQIVWEYINAIVGTGMVGKSNLIYRAHKVPTSWLLP
jgi:arylsulfotransferase ASST